jgi:hypothetical protein
MAVIRPTLIVGIGTTGLEMLEDLENLWIITFGEKMPSIFQLVVLETNRTYANPTPLGESQIMVVNIGQESTTVAKNKVRARLGRYPFWLEGVERIAGRPLEQVGASTVGGSYHIRALGRLSLWASWDDFSATLMPALGQIKPATNPAGFAQARNFFTRFRDTVSNEPVAYVVGSSGGGTGSGIVIDIGHYLYDKVSENLLGILLLPIQDAQHLNTSSLDGKAKLANTSATLKELLFYLDQKTCDDSEDPSWPNNLPRTAGIPYKLIYLEGSLELGRGFEELERIIAFRLFMGLLGLTHQVLAGGLGGAGLGALSTRFVTSGLTAFYHPRREIVEASASILGVQLINNLTKEVNAEEAKQEMRVWISDALENGLKILSGAAHRPEDDIETEVGRFRSGELRNLEQLESVLKPKFSAGGSYLGILDGNSSRVLDRFRERLEGKLIEITNQKKSLRWAEEAAKGLSSVIDEVLAYWDDIGVPRDDSDASLQAAVENRFKALRDVGGGLNPFDFNSTKLGKYYEVVEERLNGLLSLVKAYRLRRALNELKNYAQVRFQDIQTERQSLEDDVKNILLNEPTILRTHIDAGAAMLLPVYATGIFEGDVGTTMGNTIGFVVAVNQTHAGGLTVTVNQTPLDFGQIQTFLDAAFRSQTAQTWIPGDIWAIIHPSGGRTEPKDIALNIKVNLINHNVLSGKVPGVNVTSVAARRTDDAVNLARSAESGLLSLDQNRLGVPTYVIRGVLGKDDGSLAPIVTNRSLAPLGLQIFASDALRDFVAFCIEKGNLSSDLLIDPPVWQHEYDDPDIKNSFVLHTFDLEGCAKLGEMRELVQMALHLLITYNNAGIPTLSHATSIFTVQPNAVPPPDNKVVFNIPPLTPPLEVLDPIGGSDIGNVVKELAFNPTWETQFKNELRTALNNPNNARPTLERRFNNIAPILGTQKAAELRRKYFGDAAANIPSLVDSARR